MKEFRMIHNECRSMQMTVQMMQKGRSRIKLTAQPYAGAGTQVGRSFLSKAHLQVEMIFFVQPDQAPESWSYS